ncbi:type I-C CRISPR-associated protein Cas8c/Csd1 [Rosistilla oblonga]|uniref:type I-C CRISPR-associated protein Cas8c/Csd1 n=1 Tax=Rosistilla oblonga TaxID=2527990 RepID=UPI003A97117B
MFHLIKEYAESHDIDARPGFSAVNLHFLIVVTSRGSFASISRLGEGSRGQRVPACPQFNLPELKAMGSGARHFLVDSLDVVALLTKKEEEQPDDKQKAKHEGFINLLRDAGQTNPTIAQAVSALTGSLTEIQAELRTLRAKPTDKATFAIEDSGNTKWLVQDPSWHSWYQDLRESIAAKRSAKGNTRSTDGPAQMRCLLTGDLVLPAPTHDKIKGLSDVGGHSSGDILASFKQESFQHFGLKKAANSAMSPEAVSLYTTTLNRLLTSAVKIADRKIVYWYQDEHSETEPEVDPLAYLFTGQASDGVLDENEDEVSGGLTEPGQRQSTQAEASAKGVLERVRVGGDTQFLNSGRYVALSISANTTRVVIRDVREGRFEQLCESTEQWANDLRICKLNGAPLAMPSLNRLVNCTLRERQRGEDFDKWIAPASPAYTSLWNAAMSTSRQNISETIAVQAYQRLRLAMLNGEVADALDDKSKTMKLRRSAYYARIALLKLYLTRREDQTMEVALNEESNSSAYHAGRMLAVFQHVQTLSTGEPNASFLDRYYSAASTTPYQVLPRIWRIALNHLKRIQPRTLREELTDLLSDIHSQIPREIDVCKPLDLADQFQFQLGFFQQQPELPTKFHLIRRVPTKKGYLVRSKSEATIDNLLHAFADAHSDLGINIAYEPSHVEVRGERIRHGGGNESPIRPDWVIQTNKSDRKIVLEHFGMRDHPNYSQRMERKIKAYADAGLVHVQSKDIDSQQLEQATGFLVSTDETDGPNFDSLNERLLVAVTNL